ncbi:MAG: SH3 domain-containing protein [Lachnospiraceae bacterium]|nr:SH3 domain-containing protein [Lachnospiraceae bacterium]
MKQISWFFRNLSARLTEDRHFARRFVVGCLVIILVFVAIVVLASCGKGEEKDKDPAAAAATTADPAAAATEADYTPPTMEEAPLEEDAHPDVNALATQYLTAVAAGDTNAVANLKQPIEQKELLKVQVEANYLEEFDNIKVYTKPGPLANTYVAIIYYEIKFKEYETLAPGLTTHYIMPKADGSLCFCGGDMDPRVQDYIKAVVAHDDVVELFATVNTRYSEAITKDSALKAFMEVFSSNVDQQVSELMAATDSSQAPEGGEAAPDGGATGEQICTAIETVNVRASDSENGEKLGKLQQGEKVTRYAEQENGWSKVSYNGSEAFVKSEFLKVDEAAPAQEAPAEGEQATEGGEQQTAEQTAEQPAEQPKTDSSSLAGKDTITAKESVNVRKSASETGEKLGVAYQGEHFKLLQAQADGWCKIEFNGQTGYVKSEFVE